MTFNVNFTEGTLIAIQKQQSGKRTSAKKRNLEQLSMKNVNS